MSSFDVEERLANLLAVTDVQLTRLDVDDLLDEVLERLRSVLDADTAAILLLREGSNELEARAARGLEEEVREGVRIPVGTGFAGIIAERRQPAMLDQVDSSTVTNPILWEKGIRRLAGVPLMFGDNLLGVMHVGRLSQRSFTSHDTQLLQVAAERVAAAIHTRSLAIEAATKSMLERGLRPSRLPRLEGLRFASRYAPGEDRSIGGDWFDVFVVPSGEVWVVIGDVAGHGLNTAVVVGRVKSALRAYSLIEPEPARVLELTNRKLRHFEVDTMVTVQCAVARPPYHHWTIASAGHPPPVLATKGDTSFIDVKPSPPLGAFADISCAATSFDLPPDATVLFFTDGLVERRHESIDIGLERLLGLVTNSHPELVCRDVMHRLIGTDSTTDDVALLAVHRPPDNP